MTAFGSELLCVCVGVSGRDSVRSDRGCRFSHSKHSNPFDSLIHRENSHSFLFHSFMFFFKPETLYRVFAELANWLSYCHPHLQCTHTRTHTLLPETHLCNLLSGARSPTQLLRRQHASVWLSPSRTELVCSHTPLKNLAIGILDEKHAQIK